MKRLVLFMGLVLLVALAACSQQTPQATPTAETVLPTEVPPTAAPVEVAPTPEGSYVASLPHTADPALIDTVWLWERRDPNGNQIDEIIVPNPENYSLVFAADGAFFVGLDCNRGSGQYATSETGSIFMELGPTTRAMCPAGSLEEAMKQMFGPAQSYRIEEDGQVLVLSWAAGGPVDYFRSAESVVAAPGVADAALVNKVWEWERRDPAGSAAEAVEVPDPEQYTLTFNEDGTFFARLDCNTGSGTYVSAAPGELTIDLGPMTLALCPPESLSPQMMGTIAAVGSYRLEEDGTLLALVWADGAPVDYYRLADAAEPTLTGTTWQWLGTTTGEGPMTVADPTRYTITFNEDGTAAIKADCNQVVAQYTVDGSSISITPGPTTLALCPEDSQDTVFVTQLSGAAIYFFRDDNLYIDLFADAGTMQFAPLPEVDLPEAAAGQPTGTVTAPDGIFLRTGPGPAFPSVGVAAQGDSGELIGISEDGAWYVVAAPNLPEGQVWVAAEFVEATGAESLSVVATPPMAQSLVGPIWQWMGTTTPVEQITVADPSRYTITFFSDGTAGIKADCNSVTATYTVDGSSIAITPGASTLMACPEDTQDALYLQQLGAAAVYFFQGNELFIDLFASSGTMRFTAQGTTSTTEAIPTTPAGQTFRVTSFGPAGAVTPVLQGTTITAVFDTASGTVSGNGGCNSYSATLNTADGGWSVGPIASTAMACEEAVMNQEAAYLAALQASNAYQWEQQRLSDSSVVIAGTLNYTLADGTNGVINLVTP